MARTIRPSDVARLTPGEMLWADDNVAPDTMTRFAARAARQAEGRAEHKRQREARRRRAKRKA